jgi:hypothetical protein
MQASPVAVVPALALIVGTTRLLYVEWQRPATLVEMDSTGPFALLPHLNLFRALGPAFAASLGLQAGIVATMIGHRLFAATLFGVVVALLTFLMLASGAVDADRADNLPRSVFAVVLTMILAAGITTVHGLYRAHPGDRLGPESREADRRTAWKGGSWSPNVKVDVSDRIFPGIVLWPEVKPYTILVPPAPDWTTTSLASAASQPYGIPFSGEYWMFKPPQSRPPEGAWFQRGSPLSLSYRTTDHQILVMEAHQRLDRAIPMNCCRAVRIAISNADQHPGTVTMELVLVAAGREPRFVSLGDEPVTVWPAGDRPVSQVLEFPVPSGSPVRDFNEFKIVIHRDPVRVDRSARIAIDRFILVPRVA